MASMDDEDLTRRALAAYFRSGGTAQPGRSQSGVRRYRRLVYVILRTGRDVLAVYRVRNDGMLRRMKRWPEELEK